ncbi:uncharacterized protein LOC124167590 [Ischnura elegans]|uniref:uncharacterized protein LOC124167590 n=1 Tax=Ischnura elegans TaxID=197161 RepID=UPI001ED8A5BB|nr:uncharacterized protein LOC124167590 [Ischnura elegans]
MKLPWRVQLGVLAVITVAVLGILPFRPSSTIAPGTNEVTTTSNNVLIATKDTLRGDPLDTPLLRRFFMKYGEGDQMKNANTNDLNDDSGIVDSFLASRRHPCTTTGLSTGEDEVMDPGIVRDGTQEIRNLKAEDVFPLNNTNFTQIIANTVSQNDFTGHVPSGPSTVKPEGSPTTSKRTTKIEWKPIEVQEMGDEEKIITDTRQRLTSTSTKGISERNDSLGSLNTISNRINNSFKSKFRAVTSTTEASEACSVSGVVTVQDGGRLGNKLWEYAAVWALGKLLKLQPLVPKSILRHLGRYFENLSVPALEDFLPEGCSSSPESLGEPMKRWRVLPLNSLKQRVNHSPRGNLVLHRWIVLPEPIIAYRGKPMQKEFHFHQRLLEKAKQTLEWVSTEVKSIRVSMNCSISDVTFIGVHVRRTDFAQWLPRVYNKSLATASYFRQAMDYFRKKIDGPLAFMVVSDDTKWVKVNLGAKSRGSFDETHPGLNDVFLATNEKDHSSESIGHDLTLLSLCNHTIIDYGTFGSWGALLAGGETISLRLDNHLDRVLRKFIPGWTLWDDPGLKKNSAPIKILKFNTTYVIETNT